MRPDWHGLGFLRLSIVTLLLSNTCISVAAPPITAVAFAPDGESVVAASQAGLQLLKWPELTLERTLDASAANLHCLAFSSTGTQLAVGGGEPSEDGSVELFSWPAGESVASFHEHSDSVLAIAWQDPSKILTASLDREIQLLDLVDRNLSRRLLGHSRGVSALCRLHDGKTLVSAGADQSVRVWDLSSGKLVRSLNQHTAPIRALALRPNPIGLPVVASAAVDRTIRFWQPTIGRMVRYVRLGDEPLDIAWLNDGSRIVAACVDGRVRVIDPENVVVTEDLPVINGWAYAIAVHPTDGSLAVGGSGGVIRRITLGAQQPKAPAGP